MADELIQIPKPELGRPNDNRVTADYIAARPELSGVTPFDPARDVDLVDETNKALAQLHALAAYATPDAAAQMEATLAEVKTEAAANTEIRQKISDVLSTEGLRAISLADGLTAPDGTPVVSGWMDDKGYTPSYTDINGKTWFFAVQAGGAVTQAGPEGSGVAWAVLDRTERMVLWVDDQGNLHAPTLTGAALQSPASRQYNQLICIGDSMTQGLFSSHFVWTPELTAAPGGGYPYDLQQMLGSSVQVVNRGVCSATAGDVVARNFGGAGMAAQFGVGPMVNGTYPLVGLNGWSPLLTPSNDVKYQRGRLGQVTGMLSRDNAHPDWAQNRTAYYSFTPDAGQPDLETSSDPANARRKYIWHPELFHPDQPHIIWPGRNNASDIQQTVNAVKALMTLLNPRTPRIIIGVLAAQYESWGKGRETIEESNRQVGEVAGAAFLDPNEILGRNDDGSLRQDGTPNPNWMGDQLHCNDTGYQLLANALYARIQKEGWFN